MDAGIQERLRRLQQLTRMTPGEAQAHALAQGPPETPTETEEYRPYYLRERIERPMLAHSQRQEYGQHQTTTTHQPWYSRTTEAGPPLLTPQVARGPEQGIGLPRTETQDICYNYKILEETPRTTRQPEPVEDPYAPRDPYEYWRNAQRTDAGPAASQAGSVGPQTTEEIIRQLAREMSECFSHRRLEGA